LALALQARTALPDAQITVFDARPAERDVAADPRTLALSLGSVQDLQRLGLWQGIAASGQTTPIERVHVSQQQPTVLWPGRQGPQVTLSAQEQGVPQLGAVVSYGTLVSAMEKAWLAAIDADPHRLSMRFGTPVRGFKRVQTPTACGVEVDADIAQLVDLAVVAEGGVFASQPALHWPQGISRDYGQTAWVGQVLLGDAAAPHVAYERFTPAGPAALLPLAPGAVMAGGPAGPRAALVWCVAQGANDPVSALNDAQRLALLNTLFAPEVGQIRQVSSLKSFPLGLNAHTRLVADGPVVRIGNAAQTLHPVAGQGLNLGLRDVHELLAALAQHPLDKALRQFERRRQPDRWALMAATDFLARSFTWPAPILATLRGFGLGMMQSLPPVKQALAHQMMFGHR
jgi:2-octaprenyl-6-methoxyphenol hydroxylase